MEKFPLQKGVADLIIIVAFLFVPLLVILVAYCKIFHIARAHARRRGIRSFKKVLLLKNLDTNFSAWKEYKTIGLEIFIRLNVRLTRINRNSVLWNLNTQLTPSPSPVKAKKHLQGCNDRIPLPLPLPCFWKLSCTFFSRLPGVYMLKGSKNNEVFSMPNFNGCVLVSGIAYCYNIGSSHWSFYHLLDAVFWHQPRKRTMFVLKHWVCKVKENTTENNTNN